MSSIQLSGLRRATATALPVAALFVFVAAGAAAADNGAGSQAQRYWQRALTKCGDVYYSSSRRDNFTAPTGTNTLQNYSITEYKSVSFRFKLVPVSEADRLNGIEWKGRTTASWAAWRSRDPNFGWGPWEGTGAMWEMVEIVNKSGVVMARPNDGLDFVALSDVPQSLTCAELQ